MIQQIINDAKAMESEVIRSEEDAQKAYEDFVKDTNQSIEEKSKDIVNKSESKAKAEADLVEAKEDKEAVMLELEQLANYKAELHSSCDFVTNSALTNTFELGVFVCWWEDLRLRFQTWFI